MVRGNTVNVVRARSNRAGGAKEVLRTNGFLPINKKKDVSLIKRK